MKQANLKSRITPQPTNKNRKGGKSDLTKEANLKSLIKPSYTPTKGR